MNFDLPEELCMLKDSVASFCETEIKPGREAYEQSGEFPHPLISKMGEAGFSERRSRKNWAAARPASWRYP